MVPYVLVQIFFYEKKNVQNGVIEEKSYHNISMSKTRQNTKFFFLFLILSQTFDQYCTFDYNNNNNNNNNNNHRRSINFLFLFLSHMFLYIIKQRIATNIRECDYFFLPVLNIYIRVHYQ